MIKKIMILIGCFVITSLMVSCQEENVEPLFEMGTGEIDNPFIIDSYDDLFKLDSTEFYYYEIVNDLYNTNEEIIDGSLGVFNGSLNAYGHSINDVIIINLTNKYVPMDDEVLNFGLFSEIGKSSSITNLKLVNLYISIYYSGKSNVGSLAGSMSIQSSISNVSVTGRMNVNIKDGNIGGIVGIGQRVSSALSDVYMGITSLQSGLTVGGIVGYSKSQIINSMAQGDIHVVGNNHTILHDSVYDIGGIAGISQASIAYSVNDTDITLIQNDSLNLITNSIGGIAGELKESIFRCISIGTITTDTNSVVYIGGAVGVSSYMGDVRYSLILTQINLLGDLNPNNYYGNIAGYIASEEDVINIYYNEEINDFYTVGNIDDSLLVGIESHSIGYYMSGEILDYFEDKADYQVGKLPRFNDFMPEYKH
ncbi:MAG: hypothetical protein CVV56_05070 [Tenericutes bacterium HGW-Tenericutes-1]|jgi:hypothetical protein|nr:MAG: hypothetical protein CVV56_05070 [Tenericutes bacterium HGW-Tenericutes-1]